MKGDAVDIINFVPSHWVVSPMQKGQTTSDARQRAVQPHGARLLAEGSDTGRRLQASAGKESSMSLLQREPSGLV